LENPPGRIGHACDGGDMTDVRAFAEAGQLANKVFREVKAVPPPAHFVISGAE
jgi:hypothetical protein